MFFLSTDFFHSLFGWQRIEDDSCTILSTWYPCQPCGTYMIVFADVIFLVPFVNCLDEASKSRSNSTKDKEVSVLQVGLPHFSGNKW